MNTHILLGRRRSSAAQRAWDVFQILRLNSFDFSTCTLRHVLNPRVPGWSKTRVRKGSACDDHSHPDRLVGASCAQVPRCQFCAVLGSSQSHKGVVHSAAGNLQLG